MHRRLQQLGISIDSERSRTVLVFCMLQHNNFRSHFFNQKSGFIVTAHYFFIKFFLVLVPFHNPFSSFVIYHPVVSTSIALLCDITTNTSTTTTTTTTTTAIQPGLPTCTEDPRLLGANGTLDYDCMGTSELPPTVCTANRVAPTQTHYHLSFYRSRSCAESQTPYTSPRPSCCVRPHVVCL